MVRQKVCSYREGNLYDITEQIERDAERMNMVVKQVSLSSYFAGGAAVHQAIVIFGGEQNDRT